MSSLRSIATNTAALLALGVVACLAVPSPAIADDHASAKAAPLTKRERAEHALDRLSFGPRPGDVDRVERIGVEQWIDQQLHPEKINDAELRRRLDVLPAMRLSPEELIRRFPPPAMIRQVDAGKAGLPRDPVEQAIYSNALANYHEGKEKKQNAGQVDAADRNEPTLADAADSNSKSAMDAANLLYIPAATRWRAVLAMVRPLVREMTQAERQQFVAGLTPEQREVLLALVAPNRVVVEELQQEKLLRAVYSDRQLEEVMTNFWSNHFNIYLRKNGEMPWFQATYERDVIRPHAMGKFEDLLVAVAHSPAMLVYLDNNQSIGPQALGPASCPDLNARF